MVGKRCKVARFRRKKKGEDTNFFSFPFISNIRIECFWWSMMTGYGIGISIDHLQNFVVDIKFVCQSWWSKIPLCNQWLWLFFFFHLPATWPRRWKNSGGERKREKCVVEEKERCIPFFLGLEIDMEYNR